MSIESELPIFPARKDPSLRDWRKRLTRAIDLTRRTQNSIAEQAGVCPETLSRILTGKSQPRFETVMRIAHAVDENVGYLAGEHGFTLSREQRAKVQTAAVILIDLTRSYPL